MAEPLKILLVEDDEDDYLITREFLEEIPGRRFDLTWVDAYDEGMELLCEGGIDICLVDYRIGGHTGLEFLASAKSKGLQVPMVLLTGVGQRDIDVAATEAGAADFLDKSELSATMLDRTIRYSIAHGQALQSLAEKTSFLEATLENTGAGIAAFDASGTLAMSNRQFGDFVSAFRSDGIDGEIEGLTLTDLCESFDAQIEDVKKITAPDGNVYELRKNNVPLGGCVLSVLDVTKQKNFEENIIKARNDAEAASRAKSSFLANISHELRTPLHSIIGYSEIILSDSPALNARDCADQINESGNHLLSLIETVLSYSKLESGEYSCKSESIFDLDALITSALAQVADAATRKGVILDSEIDPTIASVIGDQLAIRRILVNLLSNAIEFSEAEGTVDVRLKAAGDGGAVFSVCDHGIGMDPVKAQTLNTPFQQIEDTLSRSHEGAGLGLPIAKLLAQHHDAEVNIDTEPGVGTTVSFVLPANRVTFADSAQRLAG